MDDYLENPPASAPKIAAEAPEDAEKSSDEEDGGPDWTRLSALTSSSSSKPVIPKRGDKEFEPADGGKGTNLQQHKLERVREAMFSALDVERTVSGKVISYAVWCPEISRARILSSRGSFLATMGHNVPRDARSAISTSKDTREPKKVEKAIELLPEEALYLIERASLLCWSRIEDDMTNEGVPMSVQQAYVEMIGNEELTLERYQVYAYLKRLGYTVTRARPPDPYYNTPLSLRLQYRQTSDSGVFARITTILFSPFRKLFRSRLPRIDWWRPLNIGFAHRFLSYSSIFSSLRLIPSGYSPSLHGNTSSKECSPYEVFFHLYKPVTPYRKTAPPPPDYSVIVVDRKTPMPTLHELCALFEQLPELPPPTPRKRPTQTQQGDSTAKKGAEAQYRLVASPAKSPSLYARLWDLFRRFFRLSGGTDDKGTPLVARPRRPNPFQILKTGKKMIVVAAVDAGMISFFRFCQGSFDEWPMV